MSISKAIQELREAINRGEGWPTIHLAYDALDKSVLERYGVNNPIDAMRQLDWALTKSATGTFVNVETYLKQLEEAVCVPSVTVIQAARDVISQSGPVIINEGRSNEVEVYTTDEKAIAALRAALDALESAVEGGTVEEQCHKILSNIVTRIDPDNAPVDKAYISPTMILGVVTFEEIRDIAKTLNRWEDGVACRGGWILPEGSQQ